MRTPDLHGQRQPFWREMTVADIREREPAKYVQVVFLESARFYKLHWEHPSFEKILGQLQDALAKRHVLKVALAAPDSDVIEDVDES